VIGSQLGHYLTDDRLALRQLEGTAVRDNLNCLTRGIVQHVTGPALGKMEFEFFADFRRNSIIDVISELGEELIASNHGIVALLAPRAK
jgi:hypothetical protein